MQHTTSQTNKSRTEINDRTALLPYHNICDRCSRDLCSEQKMESGSKGGEGVSLRAWTSSNSSLDSGYRKPAQNCSHKMGEEEEEDEPQMTLLSC